MVSSKLCVAGLCTVPSFLDSALFPVCLFFAVPMIGLTAGALRRWLHRSPAKVLDSSRLQFSLSALLSVALGMCLFFGIARSSTKGAFSFAMVCAGYMMVAEILFGKVSRRWTAGVLGLAIAYGLANVGVYYAVFHADPFLVFNRLFMLSVIILGPLLTVSAVVASVFYCAALRATPPWTGLAGLVLWMSGVGAANSFVIAMASAAV